ncbi:Predicted arabinose efflux permease, MFS family [Streptosporangium canum]|uniref:Predicted arabinose efflux permease, MFS family n=1 Tax=Streptosporangium canum TaxID=324952 RepID=A0A1I3ZWG8_9ACTN|nr:MFS transporter [Streptosporangium canum]SFK47996.1 Predicted arabinose efflux permease, MFS family [Streptosporangium canum]
MRTVDSGTGMWRDRSFRLFLGADAISQFGTQITVVALPLVAVLTLDASFFQVGVLTAAELAAFLFIGLPAGVWVDRLRRRPILIWSDLLRGVALLSVPLAVVLDALTLPHLYAVALLMGLGTVFFDVAHMSFLPSLVGRDDLLKGNGTLETLRNTAVLSGPALGGWLVHAVTAPIALLADAISYLVSALLLGGVRAEETATPAVERRRLREEIAEGVRYVVGHPLLRRIAVLGALTMLSNGIWAVAQPIFMVKVLHVNPAIYGLLLSGGAVGSLAGAVLAPRVAARFGAGRAMYGGAAVAALAILIAPLAAEGRLLVLFPLGCALSGMGAGVFGINQLSYRQRITPEHLLGRMNASMRFLMWGAAPIGGLLGGVLGEWSGAHATIWIGAAGITLAHLPVLTYRRILSL